MAEAGDRLGMYAEQYNGVAYTFANTADETDKIYMKSGSSPVSPGEEMAFFKELQPFAMSLAAYMDTGNSTLNQMHEAILISYHNISIYISHGHL